MYEGHVQNGVVVFDEPVSLPEGTPVRVTVPLTNSDRLPVEAANTEFESRLDELAVGLPALTSLPASFSRADVYGEHDE